MSKNNKEPRSAGRNWSVRGGGRNQPVETAKEKLLIRQAEEVILKRRRLGERDASAKQIKLAHYLLGKSEFSNLLEAIDKLGIVYHLEDWNKTRPFPLPVSICSTLITELKGLKSK